MSDSLGDGAGNPTDAQIRLYERWAKGGVALSIIGEVQGDAEAAEKPGNLVLGAKSNDAMLSDLARRGAAHNTHLWPQLGHAGAMAYPPISTAKGPSALNLPGLSCAALSIDEIAALPATFAQTAAHAQRCGFGGVQIHAAHGFLLSQFLSPLFNQRTDAYGGSITNRMRLLLQVINAVRSAVGPAFPIAVKLNATDQLDGGLHPDDALQVVAALDDTSIDLLDISGGTYFPGAKSASDAAGGGPYFIAFAAQAKAVTTKPIMVTGGFKTYAQATNALETGQADMVGLARSMIISPDLPNRWSADPCDDVTFPKFTAPPEGGITAWYTMRLTALAEDRETTENLDLDAAIDAYAIRDAKRTTIWNNQLRGRLIPD